MINKKHTYTFLHKISSVFMILALLWLTVSVAFLPGSKNLAKKDKIEDNRSVDADGEEGSSSNNSNNTEEKVPSCNSFSEEYLHDQQHTHYFLAILSTFHKCEDADTYTAFHGELLVPPPNHA